MRHIIALVVTLAFLCTIGHATVAVPYGRACVAQLWGTPGEQTTQRSPRSACGQCANP
jgi:hypothetical protein